MPFVRSPHCDHREPLEAGRGPVGHKVWTCPAHGDYGAPPSEDEGDNDGPPTADRRAP